MIKKKDSEVNVDDEQQEYKLELVEGNVSCKVSCSSATQAVYSVSLAEFRSVIQVEVDTYGYVPRNLFVDNDQKDQYVVSMNEAVKECTKTLESIGNSASTTNIKHRLLQINSHGKLNDLPYYAGKTSTTRLGNYVRTELINDLLEKHLDQLEKNFFGSQVFSIFTGDLKMNEVLSLGCFALKPSHFEIRPTCIKQSSVVLSKTGKKEENMITPSPILSTSIQPFTSSEQEETSIPHI